MAIEKMKKLRLMAIRSQKEALMRDMMIPTTIPASAASSRMKPPNGLIAIIVSAEKMPEMPNRITSAMASQ